MSVHYVIDVREYRAYQIVVYWDGEASLIVSVRTPDMADSLAAFRTRVRPATVKSLMDEARYFIELRQTVF